MTPETFLADVVAVNIDNGPFGSGRLVAPGLVLTAGHVVDYPTREKPTPDGWKICPIGEQSKGGVWPKRSHKAKVLWRGQGDLDIALLQLLDEKPLAPTIQPIFSFYGLIGSINVQAAGFPKAWMTEVNPILDYRVFGQLRIAALHGSYAWNVEITDAPDDADGWKGMSGASVCAAGHAASHRDRMYLMGVVEEVPANFSRGMLRVARLSAAFADREFYDALRTALGGTALRIVPYLDENPSLGVRDDLKVYALQFIETVVLALEAMSHITFYAWKQTLSSEQLEDHRRKITQYRAVMHAKQIAIYFANVELGEIAFRFRDNVIEIADAMDEVLVDKSASKGKNYQALGKVYVPVQEMIEALRIAFAPFVSS